MITDGESVLENNGKRRKRTKGGEKSGPSWTTAGARTRVRLPRLINSAAENGIVTFALLRLMLSLVAPQSPWEVIMLCPSASHVLTRLTRGDDYDYRFGPFS